MKRIEIAVNQLKLGMFVSALDRPWLETPYLIEGVLIKSVEDITELARHCNYVYVDIEKSNPQSISNYTGQGTKSSSQADAATPFMVKRFMLIDALLKKNYPQHKKPMTLRLHSSMKFLNVSNAILSLIFLQLKLL